jgi:uncharacterized protein YndB with AHSA1/START domain
VTSDEFVLRLKRLLPAPRPLVFRAHGEQELLAKWWGPKGFSAPRIELDLRVGGRYRIAMQPPDGAVFHLTGEFLAVDPPASLAYTFRWEEPDPDDRETVVMFSLADRRSSTELTLVQRRFATEARYALHRQGWSESLDRLTELVAGEFNPPSHGGA